MGKIRLLMVVLVAVMVIAGACSSDSSESDDGGSDNGTSTEATGSDAGSSADDGSAGTGSGTATVTIGDESFEIDTVCTIINGQAALSAEGGDDDVAVDEASGTIVIGRGMVDPTTSSSYSVTGADVTVEGGTLTAEGVAENPIVEGELSTESVDVTVEAPCA